MHARIDGNIKLLTRTGLDWSYRYRRTIEALGSLKVKSAFRARGGRVLGVLAQDDSCVFAAPGSNDRGSRPNHGTEGGN
jgi:hypothetical protein